MDHIGFDRVLSVTSEDKVHCASSLLDVRNAGLKWLSSSEDQSGKMEAELALQQPSCIKSVSVCNFGTAFIELLVGSGESGPYLTLLPSKMIMTPPESKKGLNRTSMFVITEEKLSRKASEGSWDRVLIRCRQPFKRGEQFGLSSLVLSTDPNGPSSAIPSSPKACSVPKLTNSFSSHDDDPLLPPPLKKVNAVNDKILSPGGSDLIVLASDKEDPGDSPSGRPLSPPLHPSPTMHRLMTELNQKQLQETAPVKLECIQRQRFLTREIPCSSCMTSYMASYQQAPAEDKSLDFSRLKRIVGPSPNEQECLGDTVKPLLEAVCNFGHSSAEISFHAVAARADELRTSAFSQQLSRMRITDGEVEDVGRRGHRRWRPHPRATKVGGWLTTRAVGKGVSVNVDVGSDSDVKNGSGVEERLEAKHEEGSRTCTVDLTEDMVECPLCWFRFPKSIIQIHSDLCSEDLEQFTAEREKRFSQEERGACGAGCQDVVVLD